MKGFHQFGNIIIQFNSYLLFNIIIYYLFLKRLWIVFQCYSFGMNEGMNHSILNIWIKCAERIYSVWNSWKRKCRKCSLWCREWSNLSQTSQQCHAAGG